MPRSLHFTRFILFSLALHALLIALALFLAEKKPSETPRYMPVNIVSLPRQELKKLPPLRQTPQKPRTPPPPPAPTRVFPEKRLPPEAVPTPKKFGTGDELTLPKTMPGEGKPGGAGQGKKPGKTGTHLEQEPTMRGPLPFVSQQDIEDLARKGMPEKTPGDQSITLDTDEFKYISYNRWLKIKIESVLQYPELAAVSGYQGTLYIKFDILRDGTLGGVELLKSSGYKILDDEALRTIQSAAPFAPLPPEWKMNRYSIRAAVIFYLGGGYIR